MRRSHSMTTRLIAENGLYMPPSMAGGAGGITQLTKQVAAGPGVGSVPATVIAQQSNTLYVSIDGSDVTGNGNIFNPFATYAKAAAVANAAVMNPPTDDNFWAVIFTTGTYPEDILLQPFVDIVGIDPSDLTILSGTMGLGSGYTGGGATFLSTNLSNVGIEGAITFDFVAAGAASTAIVFTDVFFDALVAKGSGLDNFVGIFFADMDTVSIDSASLTTQNAVGDLLLSLTATIGAAELESSNDSWYAGISVDGSHGFPCSATLAGSGVVGTVALNGALASYASTVDAIGTGITLAGGATQPIINGSGNATAGQALLADGAGHWAFGNVAESVPVQLRYVATTGNDVSGNGSFSQPFATVSHALATIVDASAGKPYVIFVSPGAFTDDIALQSFISIKGIDPSDRPTFSGALSIAGGFVDGSIIGLCCCEFDAPQTIDFTGTVTPIFNMTDCVFAETVALTGVAGARFVLRRNRFGSDTNFTDAASFFTDVNVFAPSDGGATIQAANVPCQWVSNGDSFGSSLNVESVAPQTQDAQLIASQSGGGNTLTLVGAGTTFEGTAGAVPPGLNLVGGASPPTLWTHGNSIGYQAFTPGNWAITSPAAVSDQNTLANSAIDRLAAAVAGLLGTPIP
jgi:hypothetical protein